MPYAPLSDGVRVHYEDVGDPRRPVVLLLGPAGSDSSAWTFQMQEVGARYRTITVDHRGSGLTEYPATKFRLTDLADDACRVLDYLRVASAGVVGVSMGGCVALELALRHPDRLWALVLAATTAGDGWRRVRTGSAWRRSARRRNCRLTSGAYGWPSCTTAPERSPRTPTRTGRSSPAPTGTPTGPWRSTSIRRTARSPPSTCLVESAGSRSTRWCSMVTTTC